ncbi:multidrug efflux system membrane fusion protein [Bradyrhizobium japonicum]|uniref:Multidrug efflux system membrane fusion protein n=1 Tax=Bradyrhizobium japonicum TaxID=375 RepID=A0ABV2RZ83_BRAJP|nr:efflux RND transporter periplasmic adaptor subunit [Bradyrhizobium japonicum]MCS3502789.1 multidrug efflux system membrane fusion protein [Bradyrhizobium japonicum]MCS3964495.1 multidrug efflux system membrane fusion protein [Bradyrhizobium japonicum]MCS3996804.1 multidrug efflux system membrane fusion protein [Bradyrhizobium japonicum]UQD95114.1 efflux RND transporter periplasmic adaptor subunit [Bradyrhizobium japonicum]WLB14947.1 efflux RND transporter periplasmic adaptor subunit [Bradyr
MLFKPDTKEGAKEGTAKKSRGRGFVMTLITLAILGGLGYFGWTVWHQQPQQANGRNQRPDLPVPVLAATPRIQDVPVYLDGVGAIRALNTVTVRSQVDGKLIAVKFTEGQDVKKGDVLGEIDPALYQATYDQAVAKKAQDEAQLANQRIDLTRYEQLAASNAGSKQQADTQRAAVAQTEALVKADQAAIDNAAATLSYTKIVAPLSGRAGLRQVDQGNIIHAADTTGLVVITQLQPIAVWFSLPQQQIMRVNAAASKGTLAVDVFGNDGITVIDTGKLTGIDNQVDQTTGTLKLKAEFPNANYQLWPGQFVNVRLKVETLIQALVVPTSAVQRGPIGTFSYVIGEDNVVSAKPVTVTQQNEHDAVIANGLSPTDKVVTTGFANLSDGSKVVVGRDDQTPSADLAPRKRTRGPDGQKKDGQARDGQKDGQGKDGEHRAKRSSSEGDQKGQTGPAPGPGASGPGAKQP